MNLDKQMSELNTFMDLWKNFHDGIDAARNKETISPEEETSFLETKAQVVQYQAILDLDVLTGQELSGSIVSLVSLVISLKDIKDQSPTQIKKIESDWHNIYMSLHALLGKMKKRKDDHVRYSSSGGIKKVIFNPVFILIIIISIIIGLFTYFNNKKNQPSEEILEEVPVTESVLFIDKDDYVA